MFYKAKVVVCSEIRTKHINAMWAPRRTWWYVKLPLGFKMLSLSQATFRLFTAIQSEKHRNSMRYFVVKFAPYPLLPGRSVSIRLLTCLVCKSGWDINYIDSMNLLIN
jgi:hypothetical protein